jgi:hypothetical protein
MKCYGNLDFQLFLSLMLAHNLPLYWGKQHLAIGRSSSKFYRDRIAFKIYTDSED